MEIPETITITGDDAIQIVAAWRAANEAPGGLPAYEAVKLMGEAVYRMALKLRENGYSI